MTLESKNKFLKSAFEELGFSNSKKKNYHMAKNKKKLIRVSTKVTVEYNQGWPKICVGLAVLNFKPNWRSKHTDSIRLLRILCLSYWDFNTPSPKWYFVPKRGIIVVGHYGINRWIIINFQVGNNLTIFDKSHFWLDSIVKTERSRSTWKRFRTNQQTRSNNTDLECGSVVSPCCCVLLLCCCVVGSHMVVKLCPESSLDMESLSCSADRRLQIVTITTNEIRFRCWYTQMLSTMSSSF